MKKLIFLAVWAIVMMGFTFVSCDTPKTVNLKSDIDSVSYILGVLQGSNLKYSLDQIPESPINMKVLSEGFKSAAKGDTIYLGMTGQEAQMYVNTFFQEFQNRIIEKDKAEADKFLAENRGKSGVITTESGLQYQVITEGTGPKPKEEDVVKIHFQITFMDGELVQSTVEQGQPVDFPIAQMFSGWKEGLLMMPVGSKYILWIPMELGIGMNMPQLNKLLIMEVELLEIVKQP